MTDDGGVKSSETAVLTEGERKLAGQAQNAFEAGSYAECVTYLAQLKELRPDDHKILHNIAVAKYYHSGLTQTGDFVQSLSVLRDQVSSRHTCGTSVHWKNHRPLKYQCLADGHLLLID